MPGPVLTTAAPILCSHGGQAHAPAANPRVTVQGAPALLQAVPMVIAGCPVPPPPAGTGPCVTATWATGALRVTSMGAPLVLADARAPCTPTPSPLVVIPAPARVKAI
jgi:hypothetical protein